MPSSRASDEADRTSSESRSISCRRNAIGLAVQQQAHHQHVLHAPIDDSPSAVQTFAREAVPLVEADGERVGAEHFETDAGQPCLAGPGNAGVEEAPPDAGAAKFTDDPHSEPAAVTEPFPAV